MEESENNDFHSGISPAVEAVEPTEVEKAELKQITTKSGHRYRPLGDRVLIRELDAPSKSTGGIYLPRSAQQNKQQRMGVVVEVGPGKENYKDPTGDRIPVCVKVGMVVNYGAYAGNEVVIDDITYKVIRDSELFGWVEGYEYDLDDHGVDPSGVSGY